MHRSRNARWFLAGALFAAISIGGSANAGGQVAEDSARSSGDLTGPWQLFVDDYLIGESVNLVRTYHAFDKHQENPVAQVKGWMPGGRGTILPAGDGAGWIRYADRRATVRSPDLIHWGDRKSAKPEAVGSAVSVMHTPWDRGREFKMVTYQKHGKSPYASFHGFYSRDGISSWTPVDTNPLMFANADTLQFGWDPHQRRYFGTMKIWTDVRGEMRRCVGITTSTDFEKGWSPARMILIPDGVDDRWTRESNQRTDFYSFSAFAYETMYLGLVEVFRVTDGRRAESLRRDPADGHIHIELLTSHDGTTWRRIDDRGPVLPVGPLGSWDAGMIKIPSHPVVDADRIKLLYCASFYSHGYGRGGYPTRGQDDDKQSALGLAVLRKDGWASLDAGQNEGHVTTRVLRGVEGPLAVNFLTARGTGYNTGWIKVEVLDEQGATIPGYTVSECDELRGDSIDKIVTWKGNPALPRGCAIRLRFVMTDARLYSFRAGDTVTVDAAGSELQVVHTFENDRDAPATVYFQNNAAIDRNAANAAFGSASVRFGDGAAELEFVAGSPRPPAKDVRGNGLELDNTFGLDNCFTLAANVNSRKKSGRQRLFSSYDPYPVRLPEIRSPHDRQGWIGSRELIMDFDPAGSNETGCLRLVVHGQSIAAAGLFAAGQYRHLAATYDKGRVALYLDGNEIGAGTVSDAPVWQLVNLRVGTDSGPFNDRFQGRAPNYQLEGNVDDIVVLGRALSSDEIQALSRLGAAAFFEQDRSRK